MLGIVFTGGESPTANIIKNELKGKKPFIVAADSGLIAAESAGIKADYVVGDMDSVETKRLASYPSDCVIRYRRDKDFTDTELALEKVFKKGCKDVWIIGGGGGRNDHFFAIHSLFEREVFPSRWMTGDNDIRCIDAEVGVHEYSATLAAGTQVSVFPIGKGDWDATSKGLKWPLESLYWDRGVFGLSNVSVDGFFYVTALSGRFLVVLPLPEDK